MFKSCQDGAQGKAKIVRVSKTAVSYSTIKEGMLFLDISSPPTANMGGKKTWLLVVEDSTDYVWKYFLKEISGRM